MRKYVLDLSEIYSDHRRKAYLGHRQKWTTIFNLIQTVKEIFGIHSHVHVCSAEQIFYPDSESVEILRDGETLKILLDPAINEKQNLLLSEEDIAKVNDTNNQQDSTFEDIEATLCSLPKPKRRRIRKRKPKKGAEEELAHCPASEAVAEERDRNEKDKIDKSTETKRMGKSPATKLSSSEVDERPYRNLNRQKKARVVRAMSLSTLSTPTPDELFISPASELNCATANDSLQEVLTVSSTESSKKARVVRALSLEDSVQVKRELIEACGNGLPSLTLEIARQIALQMGSEETADVATDEHEASLTNDMETYSTMISDV